MSELDKDLLKESVAHGETCIYCEGRGVVYLLNSDGITYREVECTKCKGSKK